MTETVTRLRATTSTDEYGNEGQPSWATPAELELPARGIEPVSSDEITGDGRKAVVSGWRVYLEAGADVTSADRLRLRGGVCEVLGEPADWRSPSGIGPGGLVITVQKVG